MNLADRYFTKGDFLRVALQAGGPLRAFKRYSYETHRALYDVDVLVADGSKTYHVDCGPSIEPVAIHRAIEKRYKV